MSMWNADYGGGAKDDNHPVGAPMRGKKSVPGVADVYTGKTVTIWCAPHSVTMPWRSSPDDAS